MNPNPRCRASSGLLSRCLTAGFLLLACWPVFAASGAVLVYHRFGPTVADSMTTRTETFEAQIARMRQEGYAFVPLSKLVAGIEGRDPLPPKAVAITADDGHITVYSDLLPIIRREKLPVTLFIYPSAISNASYAMTWDQLAEIKGTGLVEIHSHTYWHPNFRNERKRLAPEEFRKFVRHQLEAPRKTLKNKLGVDAEYLAWPFGIHDPELEEAAAAAGYRASFALEERHATGSDPAMALPRYLIVDRSGVTNLVNLLKDGQRRAGAQP